MITKEIRDRADRPIDSVTFLSLRELKDFSQKTPINRMASGMSLSSRESDSTWAGASWEEAETMLSEGWTAEAAKITQKLKVSDFSRQMSDVTRRILDVQGFAPVVPLAIQGIPTSMVSRKKFQGRDRVITVNKSIAYNCGVRAWEIEQESLKALGIVRKLEAAGYSVNLNVVWAVREGRGDSKQGYMFKVRIKNARERLNISKMAFPLVHPAFLRRTMFDVLEKWPGVPTHYRFGYGRPIADVDAADLMDKREVLLPAFIDRSLADIQDASELANALNIM